MKPRKTSRRWHGGKGTPEYAIWRAMLDRCNHRARPESARNYRDRGIRVCERWQRFEFFLADVGRRPAPHLTLERIDNDGHYEPGNVRWATRAEQNENRRNTRRISFNGKTQSIAAWNRELGLGYGVLRRRLKEGWPLDVAMTGERFR